MELVLPTDLVYRPYHVGYHRSNHMDWVSILSKNGCDHSLMSVESSAVMESAPEDRDLVLQLLADQPRGRLEHSGQQQFQREHREALLRHLPQRH